MTEDQYEAITTAIEDIKAGMDLIFEEVSGISRRIGLPLDAAKKPVERLASKKALPSPEAPPAAATPRQEPEVPAFASKRYKDFTKEDLTAYQKEYYRCVVSQKRKGLPVIYSAYLDRPKYDRSDAIKKAGKASLIARQQRLEQDLAAAKDVLARAAQGGATPRQITLAAAIIRKHVVTTKARERLARKAGGATAQASG